MRSITPGTNDRSTRVRPIPSIRDGRPVVCDGSSPAQPSKKAEFSGSTTHSRVG